jgi:hypothetical protein
VTDESNPRQRCRLRRYAPDRDQQIRATRPTRGVGTLTASPQRRGAIDPPAAADDAAARCYRAFTHAVDTSAARRAAGYGGIDAYDNAEHEGQIPVGCWRRPACLRLDTRARLACVVSYAASRFINGQVTAHAPSRYTAHLGKAFDQRTGGIPKALAQQVVNEAVNL